MLSLFPASDSHCAGVRVMESGELGNHVVKPVL